jgi:AcrR family transcriptional regulator
VANVPNRQTSITHRLNGEPQRLLAGAQRLMLEEGHAAATGRIAAEAGVNVALVYYYCANMDEQRGWC